MENTPAGTPVIKIGIVDDHLIVVNGITEQLNKLEDIRVTLQATSGEQLLLVLKETTELPDIILMDILMKGMDGIEATRQVTALYPRIKIIALTSVEDERSVIQMMRAGGCAFLTKEVHPLDLEDAIREIYAKGKYHADIYHLNARSLKRYEQEKMQTTFTPFEIQFLQLCRDEQSYPEIAKKLFLSLKTVEHYRSILFEKLGVNKTLSMVMEAVRRGLIDLGKTKN